VIAASTIQLGNPQAESLAPSGPARAALYRLEGSGIGTGPLSPFDTLVASEDPVGVVAALERVDGVRSAIAPAAWRRDGVSLVSVIPAEDANPPAGRETLERIRVATRGEAVTVARRRRAPTSSTRSTAPSRSSWR
jgi:putative drug exporter of the RND superfamily